MTDDTRCAQSVCSGDHWKHLFKAALLEPDAEILARRLEEAKHAIMDRIEDSFDTASLSERRLLLAALGTVGELQRLSGLEDVPHPLARHALGHAA